MTLLLKELNAITTIMASLISTFVKWRRSPFRINVDGEFDGDLSILPGDSIFIFIEVIHYAKFPG